MSKKMLIDASHPEETRVAVVQKNQVEDFDFESAHRKPLRGNIYLARVTRVEPSLQAAFVEYGGNRHGFLAFSEIHPDYYHIPVADREELNALDEELAAAAAEIAAGGVDDDDLDSAPPEDDQDGAAGHEDDDGEAGPDIVEAETDFEVEDISAAQVESPQEEDNRTDEPDEADVGQAISDLETPHAAEPVEGGPDVSAPSAEASTADAPQQEPFGAAEQDNISQPGEASQSADDDDDDGGSDGGNDGGPKYMASSGPSWPKTTSAPITTEEDATSNTPSPEATAGETSQPAADAASASEAIETPAETPQADEQPEALEARTDTPAEEGETAPEQEEKPKVLSPQDRYDAARRKRARLLRRYKIQEVIKSRQIILVQVVKEERGNKGAALTTYMSIAGRYCVLMPNTARGGGISRKITSPGDRKRLRKVVNEFEVPQGMGLIVRTAGAKRTKVEIKRDYEYLLRLWENIRELTLKSIAPALIYEEANLIKRAIRDLYDKDVDSVLVEGEDGYREAKDFMRMLMPSHAKHVQPYKDRKPLFLRHNVEKQLDSMFNPNVQLKSGGYIVIHQTEALVAIDVNSGRATKERNIETTALKTNLEAAEEVARQCRLRDLAGLLVIDFIDMEEQRNNRAVEKRLKEALKHDRARLQIGRISPFGLLEMSRQRRRSNIADGTTQVCPTCNGAGVIRSVETAGLRVLRAIEEEGLRERCAIVTAKVGQDVAMYILNCKRERLKDIETLCGVSIEILVAPEHIADKFEIEYRGTPRPQPQDTADQVVRIDQPEVEADDDAEAAGGAEDGAPQDEERAEGAERKRRRRRRRRKSADDAAAVAGEGDAAEEAEAAGSADADSETTPDGEEDGAERKRRRRGRRGGRRNRRRSSEDATATAEAASDKNAEGEAETNADANNHTPEDDVAGPIVAAVEGALSETAHEAEPSVEGGGENAPADDTPASSAAAVDPEPIATQVEPEDAPAFDEPVFAPEETAAADDGDHGAASKEKTPLPEDTPKSENPRRGWWQRAIRGEL
ncbi:MAG: Rne/Rng family ribonuclease [Pseudomonadota bacterium]